MRVENASCLSQGWYLTIAELGIQNGTYFNKLLYH